MTISIHALGNAFQQLGVAIKHPRPVQLALQRHEKLSAFTGQQLPNAAELAAAGDIDGACAAITLTAQVDTLRHNGALTLTENAITEAVANVDNANKYLAQVADIVTEHALNVERLAGELPTNRPDWASWEVASRLGYGSQLGSLLDSANALQLYARKVAGALLVSPRDRMGRVTAVAHTLFEVPDELTFAKAVHAQHNCDMAVDLHQTSTVDGIVQVAIGAYTPVSLAPVTTAADFHERFDGWVRAIAFTQSARAAEAFANA
ncbi:hypothetical protein LH935_16485 [Gordonia polyisoprenivorans]|uniref:hypothetical protein n=1 Tax=Gordonia polyisoprenivorans TaxID=84595 RepID=UPI0022340E9E|nr:hypothetical protein LH935_16485 [Gordonia polyisoprenivorans]